MTKMKFCRGAIAMLVLTAFAVSSRPASAQILIAPDLEVYTSQSAYAADSTSIVDNITFNGLSGGQSTFTQYPTLTVGGATFTPGPSDELFVVGPGYTSSNNGQNFNFPGDGTSTLFVQSTTTDPASVTATLPVNPSPMPGITAVGTNIGSGFYSSPITVTINLVGSATPITYIYDSADASTSGLGYLGFTTTDGAVISSITFSDSVLDPVAGVPDFALDNFTYGIASAAAPEPVSWALLASGLAGLALFRRRVLSR